MKQTRKDRWKFIMPRWTNGFYCNEARTLVDKRNAVTDIEWQLDHIIPVTHARVCGLHVDNNLQVIPAKLNSLKSNHYARRFLWSEFFSAQPC